MEDLSIFEETVKLLGPSKIKETKKVVDLSKSEDTRIFLGIFYFKELISSVSALKFLVSKGKEGEQLFFLVDSVF